MERRQTYLQMVMKHLHHDYDVDAAIYMWEHIEDLEYIRVSTLGEGKDMTLQENIDNVQHKRDRHVEDYVIYRLKYRGRNFLIKTERLTYGIEQPYSLQRIHALRNYSGL